VSKKDPQPPTQEDKDHGRQPETACRTHDPATDVDCTPWSSVRSLAQLFR
jgi:hypothetical protein